MGKVIPLLLAVIGLGGGVGAGVMLRPAELPLKSEAPCGVPQETAVEKPDDTAAPDTHGGGKAGRDYVKLSNQFVVPVVADGRVGSLVVMSLSLEIPPGQSDGIYEREPKLRDAFLQVMFDHANAGGFDGAFTRSGQMKLLRSALRETAQRVIGPTVFDVLILDIVRQDA